MEEENNNTEKQCDIHVVSSSNNFLIRQISEKEFIILKKFKKETTKGYFWWRRTIINENYKRVDKYGKPLFIRRWVTNIGEMIEYETIEEAEHWIANYKKYPIDYYC
jgi:hypothetical protein